MGVLAEASFGVRNPDTGEEPDGPISRFGSRKLVVCLNGLGYLASDRIDRIQARIRILGHQGDLVAANARPLRFGRADEIPVLEEDLASSDQTVRWQQSQNG